MVNTIKKSSKSGSEFTTGICCEKATDDNPFVAKSRSIRGYDSRDLWQNSSYMDVLLLHFTKDLPSSTHRRALEMLFVGLMNLGPREVDSRAAMTAGISKTRPEHLLSIGLLAGQNEANAVCTSHKFIQKHSRYEPQDCFNFCMESSEADEFFAPGFGNSYGSIDPLLNRLALDIFEVIPESAMFAWCLEFVDLIQMEEQGWLASGLTAAVCLSLGISANNALGIYQLAKSVGIVAYGMEQSILPMSRAPLLSDEYYEHTT